MKQVHSIKVVVHEKLENVLKNIHNRFLFVNDYNKVPRELTI